MELNQNHEEFIKRVFIAADNNFKKEIREDGILLRFSSPIEFSSKALFSSLIKIGIPPEIAIKLPFEIIPFLKKNLSSDLDEPLSTANIRIAVVQALQVLELDPAITRETIAMWSAAYIRRYGNPENQFVKIIDNGVECDLNYDYISNKILPHLITRIIDVPSAVNPCDQYASVFSNTIRSAIAKEIMEAANSLNIYSMRYKTLINLLQDIVLEPPHPWMVNRATIDKVVDYNLDRVEFYLDKINEAQKNRNSFPVQHSLEECARHAAAAILAKYGAFLGVGCRYGLMELRRMLNIKSSNKSLWDFCTFHDIELDLKAIGYSADYFNSYIERLISSFNIGHDQLKLDSLKKNVINLSSIAKALTGKQAHDVITEVEVILTCYEKISYDEKACIVEYIHSHLNILPSIVELNKRCMPGHYIAISLPTYQANRLQWAFEAGRLSHLKVRDVSLKPPIEVADHEDDSPSNKFDVFICYNSADKAEVRKIVASLKKHRVSPWFDESQLRPGFIWQREIEEVVDQISCAAVFIGENGIGPWQDSEVELLLRRLADKRCPIIPVILKNCKVSPSLPGFIGGRTVVDFRKKSPPPIEHLYFGITGKNLATK